MKFVGWAELREAQQLGFVGLRSSAPTYDLQSIAILRQAPGFMFNISRLEGRIHAFVLNAWLNGKSLLQCLIRILPSRVTTR